METKVVRNLIFDFGGVIIDIDFEKTISAFIKLGAENFGNLYSKATQSGIFDKLDKGNIKQDDFIETLSCFLPESVSKLQIITAWNQIIIGIPEKRISLLESLRPSYKTFLLSNTNAIHYDYYMPKIKKQWGYSSLEEIFDCVFLSFRLGIRKPDQKIFDHVFNSQNLKKEETLFIDDSKHIIEAARSFGIPSFWLKDGLDICDLFENNLLKKNIFSL